MVCPFFIHDVSPVSSEGDNNFSLIIGNLKLNLAPFPGSDSAVIFPP